MFNKQAVVFLNDSPHVKTPRANREEKRGGIKGSLPLLLDVTCHVFIHGVAMEGGKKQNKNMDNKYFACSRDAVQNPAAGDTTKLRRGQAVPEQNLWQITGEPVGFVGQWASGKAA